MKGARGLLAAAKLNRSMTAHPELFSKVMRDRAAQHLSGGESAGSDDPRLLEAYCRQIPLEKQKLLGYHLTAVSHIYRALREGRPAQAELLCLRAAAAVEQSTLDGHWATAWNLSSLPETPWGDWERTSVATHRRSHAASPLLSEAWVSTAIFRVKDEAYLKQQRAARTDEEARVDTGPGPKRAARGTRGEAAESRRLGVVPQGPFRATSARTSPKALGRCPGWPTFSCGR